MLVLPMPMFTLPIRVTDTESPLENDGRHLLIVSDVIDST